MADKVVIIRASRGQDWRLLNFYREARPKDCQLHREGSNRFFRISPIAITLSRPITRASHTGTGRTSNTFADTFDHGPGIVNQFTEKLGFLALHALPAGLRQLSHGLLGPKRGSRGLGRYGWPGGGRIGRRSWTRSRSRVKERTPFTNLLSLPNNADTPCAKQPERGSL